MSSARFSIDIVLVKRVKLFYNNGLTAGARKSSQARRSDRSGLDFKC